MKKLIVLAAMASVATTWANEPSPGVTATTVAEFRMQCGRQQTSRERVATCLSFLNGAKAGFVARLADQRCRDELAKVAPLRVLSMLQVYEFPSHYDFPDAVNQTMQTLTPSCG